MILYPAIDLQGGRVVSLVGGRKGTQRVDLPDAAVVRDRWIAEGAKWLHVVDLDAAFGDGDNRRLVRTLLRTPRARVQVGGGVRADEDVRELLDAGAARVIVGTRGLRDPDWLRRTAEANPDRVLLAVDARDGQVVARGWTEGTGRSLLETTASVEDIPLAGLLYTAVQVEGRLQGADRTWTPQLVAATRHPVIASGGVATLDDVRFLREAGCAGFAWSS